MNLYEKLGLALITWVLVSLFLPYTPTKFALVQVALIAYVVLFLWKLRTTARLWLRRALLGGMVFTTMALLTVAHSYIDDHIDQELRSVRERAATAYDRAHPPAKPEPRNGRGIPSTLEEWQARYGGPTPEADAAADAACDTWNREHADQLLARDVLALPATVVFSVIADSPEENRRRAEIVIAYFSLPFKIALGIGFGIALGAWIVKNWT